MKILINLIGNTSKNHKILVTKINYAQIIFSCRKFGFDMLNLACMGLHSRCFVLTLIIFSGNSGLSHALAGLSVP